MKRLVLVGGGHAHLFVLESLARLARRDIDVTVVSPGCWQYYSGMMPGWMAGHYSQEDIRIDLRRLADRAGARFVQASMVGMDAGARRVQLSDGSRLRYDRLSLDIGSETRRDRLDASGRKLLTVKPLEVFQRRWADVMRDAVTRGDYRLVVIGGGAAGVELALSANRALRKACPKASVRLVTGADGFLRDHSPSVRRRAIQALKKAGVEQIAERAAGAEDGVTLASGEFLGADAVLAATGASAPAMLKTSGLRLDAMGFVSVDPFHRSLSHPEVFAAGDVCSRDDPHFRRSGVHAVHAGPVLAENLLAAIDGRPMKAYRPRKTTLYLLACGDRYAIASWGRFSIEGHWVWKWKDRIDRRFVARFSPGAAAEPADEGSPHKRL
ncbi:FAD-dependent oxidoreductase [Rhizobium sp. TRM95796]|uniref:FAD-dependent oxidoreductase n=1 Tax=Rhizobium sp. TRM95796 TaxID=2979862 RepID=UPI0021E871A0|nr:FAD-dependent oxidoreductase [Rhizobium sp. TRM95796]MCV3764731.1 FAD-dependent oxidoreductase [Rhizobium sp. TRM95796]